jgi:hypothetical protein
MKVVRMKIVKMVSLKVVRVKLVSVETIVEENEVTAINQGDSSLLGVYLLLLSCLRWWPPTALYMLSLWLGRPYNCSAVGDMAPGSCCSW